MLDAILTDSEVPPNVFLPLTSQPRSFKPRTLEEEFTAGVRLPCGDVGTERLHRGYVTKLRLYLRQTPPLEQMTSQDRQERLDSDNLVQREDVPPCEPRTGMVLGGVARVNLQYSLWLE
ncbi:hypothetical protein E2C01_038257 [Portunus trituberculatus]|uniref:Uncharacterized protein n=1 Tax=Portunus trituberculatus TaxID=210409 RepID=A0A5B7FBR5_PORTR|nr:hypothetical protein [Portunus trituberculatus]